MRDAEIKKAVNEALKRDLNKKQTEEAALEALGFFAPACRWNRWVGAWQQDKGDMLVPVMGVPRGLPTTIRRELDRQRALRVNRAAQRRLSGYVRGGCITNEEMGPDYLHNKVIKRYFRARSFAGNTVDRDRGELAYVADYSPRDRAALIRAEGWCQYSRRYGHTIRLAGLVLRDPDTSKLVFIRVPPDTRTVADALESLKPAAVRKAEAEGKAIIRQGDFYLVPQRSWNLEALRGTRHDVSRENGTAVVSHPQHGTIQLTTPHKAVRQVQTSNAAFSNRGYAD